jgi:hypothetical protein
MEENPGDQRSSRVGRFPPPLIAHYREFQLFNNPGLSPLSFRNQLSSFLTLPTPRFFGSYKPCQ